MILLSIIAARSGLICLNWYDWNNKKEPCVLHSSTMSGLICLNWYDWNTESFHRRKTDVLVGIDLPELIRLKRKFIRYHMFSCPVVGIDLPELIRLKHNKFITRQQLNNAMSGLICLNWYDWNYINLYALTDPNLCRDWSAWIDTIETINSILIRGP